MATAKPSECTWNKALVQYVLYYLGVFGCGLAQEEGIELDSSRAGCSS